MGMKMILEGCYTVKTRDRIGGTIRTDVYQFESGIFQAFSTYAQDKEEEYVGFAESFDNKEAIKLSRMDLRRDWKEEQSN